MAQSFALYLLNKVLPSDVKITGPVTNKELKRLLIETSQKHPDKYGEVVTKLKSLGDKFSTYEAYSFGMTEIGVPNKVERDRIIEKAQRDMHEAKGNDAKEIAIMEKAQVDILANDTRDGLDDATLMVRSGAYAGPKANQLMKLRSTPFVVKDHSGNIVRKIINKSYSQGLDVEDFWNGAAESRANLAVGQVSTSEPGSLNKTLHNLLGDVVISEDDCKTKYGIHLPTQDVHVLDRYLAAKEGAYPYNTLVTKDVQASLLRAKVTDILVRSPQTCEANQNTVCAKCMGLSIGLRKNMSIGTNIGAISAGSIAEPAQQLVLGAKHSTTLAKAKNDLEGSKGLMLVTEMPKIYVNQQIVSEMYGKITQILPAPQGGTYLRFVRTKPVPAKYIVNAEEVDLMPNVFQYYIPPQRKLLKGIAKDAEVYPGLPLTDGNPNLKDIARLQGLGAARTAAVNLVGQVFSNTGQSLDRRHYEVLAKSMLNTVKIDKAPASLPFQIGDVVQYNNLRSLKDKFATESTSLASGTALGKVLAREVAQYTIGTELTPMVVQDLRRMGVQKVLTTKDLEVTPHVVGMSFVQTLTHPDWVGGLNHRYLKDTIEEAAQYGLKQSTDTYNPHAAYAIGTEMKVKSPSGKY